MTLRHTEDKYDTYGGVARSYQGGGEASRMPFEKTWGHRILLGLSISMLVAALVVIVVCAVGLAGMGSLVGAVATATVQYMLYLLGLVASALVVPPAILGIVTARKPQLVLVAVGAAVFALVLVAAFFVYALAVLQAALFAALLYAVLLALVPVIYLVCALKIWRSGR